uniref:WGR domain-containing protein n=1 Tax=Denticeps clupeoides TaxID=299321 RepID=A0A8C4CXF2_9TELE
MAPKRRAASFTKAGGKKVKQEPEPPKDAYQSAREALKASTPQEKGQRKVDVHCVQISAEVHEDYDCMLNQTNIGSNNNKFYVIQVLKSGNGFYCWTRWGRVGETGQSKLLGPYSAMDQATREFQKKFREKTKNSWEDRKSFVSHSGKYTLIEVDGDDEAEVKVETVDGPEMKATKNVLPCTLDGSTQKLIELIFSKQMFNDAMEAMNLGGCEK